MTYEKVIKKAEKLKILILRTTKIEKAWVGDVQ